MQQIIKRFQPMGWITAILFSVILASGCSGDSTKTEQPIMETAPVTTDSAKVNSLTPGSTDSLPKIDTSASSRPEGIKTKAKTVE
jgi:PBP1b-binding outer membrane lipoprotein LpoB